MNGCFGNFEKFVCINIYCVSALSLHIESTDSMIQMLAQNRTAVIKVSCLATLGNNDASRGSCMCYAHIMLNYEMGFNL